MKVLGAKVIAQRAALYAANQGSILSINPEPARNNFLATQLGKTTKHTLVWPPNKQK